MQQQLIAGYTLNFDTQVPDYSSSDGWSALYRLIPRTSGTALTITGTGSGTTFTFAAAAATTANWAAGEYSWVLEVSKGSEYYPVDRGTITILPNLRTSTGYDDRSQARQILDALMALQVSNAVSQGLVAEYSIAGRTLRFKDQADLITQIRFWQGEVAREERAAKLAAGLDTGATLRVRL